MQHNTDQYGNGDLFICAYFMLTKKDSNRIHRSWIFLSSDGYADSKQRAIEKEDRAPPPLSQKKRLFNIWLCKRVILYVVVECVSAV